MDLAVAILWTLNGVIQVVLWMNGKQQNQDVLLVSLLALAHFRLWAARDQGECH